MDLDKLNKWLGVIANIGIIAGLVLIGFEMNQNRHLVRGELGTQQRDYYQQIYDSVSGEDIRSILSLAITEPEKLSLPQLMAIDKYMHNVTGHIHRERLLYDFGIFKDDPAGFERWVVQQFFGNKYSRIWWAENKSEFPVESIQVIEDEMSRVAIDRDRRHLERVRERITQEYLTSSGCFWPKGATGLLN